MRSHHSLSIFATFACVASLGAVLTACAGRGALAPASPTMHSAAHVRGATTPIQHVVIITQENRTFDYMFQGYPGANTASTGKNSKGRTITLKPIPLTANYDIGHGFKSFIEAWDKGAMDGFDLEGTTGSTKGYPNPEYGYAPQSEIGPYLSMAQQYVLNDNTFSSQIDSSFTAHQYLIAGQSQQAVNTPTGGPYWGCDGSGELIQTLTIARKLGTKEAPCFDYTTLADELNNATLTWRFYAPSVATQSLGSIWSAYQAVNHIRFGSQWSTNVISPETSIVNDVAGGTLENVTWVVPAFKNSDHPRDKTVGGPDWVASVVNAIGESPFWDSTVIFVVWDDWGGWYDHVPPPQVDYDGLGIRIPLLVISPYAKQGYVSHVQYETASLLKYAEDNFGLAPMSAADTRATDPVADTLDYTQNARKFVPIKLNNAAGDVLRARSGPDLQAPDDD